MSVRGIPALVAPNNDDDNDSDEDDDDNDEEDEYEDDDDDYPLEVIRENTLNWILEARNWLDAGAEDEGGEQPLPTNAPTTPGMSGMPGAPGMMSPQMGPATVPVPEAAGLATQPIPMQ